MYDPLQNGHIESLKHRLASLDCERMSASELQEVLGEVRNALHELQRPVQELDPLQQQEDAGTEDLVEAAEMYKILAEETLVGVYIIQDGKFVYANGQFAMIFGRSRNELVGLAVLDLVTPEDRDLVQENLRARVEGEMRSIRYRARCLHASGSLLNIEIYGTRTQFRGCPAVIGTLLDRTEEEIANQALRRSEQEHRLLLEKAQDSEEKWRSLVENPFDFVVIVDREGLYQYINRTSFGLKMEDLVGKKSMFDFIAPEYQQQARSAVEQVFETGEATYYEAFTLAPVNRWYGSVVGPITRDSVVVAASVLTRDITQQKEAEIALRESEERFRQLAENIDDVFYLYDPQQDRILYASPAYDKIWGRSREELYEDSEAPNRSVLADDLQRVRCALSQTPEANQPGGQAFECRIRRPDGDIRWLRHRRYGVGPAASPGRIAGVITDITTQRNAEQRLREAEAKFRLLVERLPIITYISPLENPQSTLYVSPQVESILGFTPEEWLADASLWENQIHPDDRDHWRREQATFRRTGKPLRLGYRLLSAEGETRTFREEAVVIRDGDGKSDLIHGLMLDVTEVEEARVGQQRAQQMSSSLVEVQETERRRIARELHDEIGQTLTGLKLLLEMKSSTREDCHLEEAGDLVNELLSKVSELSLDLRPAMLDDLGLLAALFWLFERYTKRTGIQVHFQHRGLDRRFDSMVETAAYRIAQEGLTNVARHAGVGEVQVRAWVEPGMLSVQVQDEGAGFELQSTSQSPASSGLLGMLERTTLLGGKFEIESSPGKGTRLTARFPVQAQEQREEGLQGGPA